MFDAVPPRPRPEENDSPARPDLSHLPVEVADALAALMDAHRVLAGIDPSRLDGKQAATVASVLASTGGAAAATGARLLPVIEADGIWAVNGAARSFAHWVADEHRVSLRTARVLVRTGRALRDDLPATAVAA